jgi:predicted dehydrogenase
LQLDYDTMELWHSDQNGQRTRLAVPDGDRFVNEVRAFAASVTQQVPLRVSGADGRAATDILVRAYQSAQQPA